MRRGEDSKMEKDKKILYSGMQATGTLTLGNYLGALKNWVGLCDEYECFYGVMDLHSLTVRQNPTEFRQNAKKLYANGVSKEVLDIAEQRIKIPMLGKTESLNAAVATGIVVYEYVRRKL